MGLNHGKNIGQQSRDTLPLSKKSDMVNSVFTVMHMNYDICLDRIILEYFFCSDKKLHVRVLYLVDSHFANSLANE